MARLTAAKNMITQPTEGRIVKFKPSERTLAKFNNKRKETYPAIVTEINDQSIDLTVFGVGEEVHVTKVKHALVAEENRSSWDWPARE